MSYQFRPLCAIVNEKWCTLERALNSILHVPQTLHDAFWCIVILHERWVHIQSQQKIIINDTTFSVLIQPKLQTTWQLFVYFVDKATKATKWEIVSPYPKTKTRVHPHRNSRNSDGTPFWIQNDNTRPTNLISSIYTKNSLQNRTFTIPSPTSAGTRRTTSKTHLKIG